MSWIVEKKSILSYKTVSQKVYFNINAKVWRVFFRKATSIKWL